MGRDPNEPMGPQRARMLQRRSGALIDELVALGHDGTLAIDNQQTERLLEYLVEQHGIDVVAHRLAQVAANEVRTQANRRAWTSISRILRDAAARVAYIYERT